MAGMQFEYDEQGGTFYYFLLSFIALVLFPATYYLWPRKEEKDDVRQKRLCHCQPCQNKRLTLKASQPWTKCRRAILKCVIIIGWIIFAYVAYKTSQVELDFKEFDPYAELGIDRGAETADIKKAYRRLSLIYHPDRETGDSHKFMRITKAYDALTDEEARKNWEEYGNPDGPGATHLGIALPKWIVEKKNSFWVLGLYGLIFMIILPVCVGTWWYRSIKYSAQQVLIETTRLYFHFLRKSPNMIPKRVIMVLAASHEFNKHLNNEIIERPSDNVEIPELIRDLPGLTQNNREPPFYYPYCVKARALLMAHFSRKELPTKTLQIDKNYALLKCPYLLNEMLNVAQQLFFLAQTERVQWKLSLDTIENIMRTSQMVVQGLWSQKSPLLQLPHISEDMLRHFVTKRRNIRNFKQFLCMSEEDRRALLRQLTDAEYRDVMNVCATLPNVDMEVHCEVKGEDDKTVTAGSLVTISVKLVRHNMSSQIPDLIVDHEEVVEEDVEEDKNEELEVDEEDEQNALEPGTNKTSSKWMKTKKKKGAKKGKKKAQKVIHVNKAVTIASISATEEKKDVETNHQLAIGDSATSVKKEKKRKEKHSTDDESLSEDESAEESLDTRADETSMGDDEDEWMKFQQETRKDNILETKSKETHMVHSPHFPIDKYEWWWLYLAETKKKQLIAGPLQICTLKDMERKELQFRAPNKSGNYQFAVFLRSDSYLGVDQTQSIKVDVKEAKKYVETHPQWEISDDEDDKKADEETESDVSSGYEESNDDD